MEHEKLLTIAVPAYNAEQTLGRCLDSVVSSTALPFLDIIVINDGSLDRTGSIMEAYARRCPGSFQLIHKENGGHGSVINAAIGLARGAYFKVLDADDTLVTENVTELIDILRTVSADAVISPFRMVREGGGLLEDFSIDGLEPDRDYFFADFWKTGKGIQLCCFHGLLYRTDFYRSCGIRLSEHIFFEDHEYATLPFQKLQTLRPVNLVLYEYTMGREQQSVSNTSQLTNIAHLEQVFWVQWTAYRTLPRKGNACDEASLEYFRYKMAELFLSYCTISLLKNSDRRSGREQARFFFRQIKNRDRLFSRYIMKRYLLVLALHFAGFSGIWNMVRRLPGYRVLRRLAH